MANAKHPSIKPPIVSNEESSICHQRQSTTTNTYNFQSSIITRQPWTTITSNQQSSLRPSLPKAKARSWITTHQQSIAVCVLPSKLMFLPICIRLLIITHQSLNMTDGQQAVLGARLLPRRWAVLPPQPVQALPGGRGALLCRGTGARAQGIMIFFFFFTLVFSSFWTSRMVISYWCHVIRLCTFVLSYCCIWPLCHAVCCIPLWSRSVVYLDHVILLLPSCRLYLCFVSLLYVCLPVAPVA